MGILTRAADLVYTFRFLKLLVTPFEKTDAYKLGIIDIDGRRVKSVKLDNDAKKSAYTPFHRLVYNTRRAMAKIPFGATAIASYAAALWLIHEEYGVNIEKVLKETNMDPAIFISESTAWFVTEDNMLTPGIYRVQNAKMLNSNYSELVKPKDKIRVYENSYPVGRVGQIDIYEAVHLNTNHQIYVTVPELLK